MSSPKITCVAKNSTHSIGEGPHWDERKQSLYYVDYMECTAHAWNYNTNSDSNVRVTGSGSLSFVIPSVNGEIISGYNNSLIKWSWDKPESHTVLAEVEEGLRTHFNDGKCDRNGRLWAGTMAKTTKVNPTLCLEKEMGSLYCLSKCNITRALDKITLSNGITWSVDGKSMFYVDCFIKTVFVFDYDESSGSIGTKRIFTKFVDEAMGFPDGMCTDARGNIWIACFNAGKVVKFDTNTGKLLQEIAIPAHQVTSCCFGGPNLDELFVTSGCLEYSEEDRKNDPMAGSLFKVTDLGEKGLLMNCFEG